VLDQNEGALAKMIPAFKFFVGGPIGSGKQWFPWVHIDDLVGIFLFAIDNGNVHGVLNGSSPLPVTMKIFSKKLGKVLKRPSIFKVPAIVVKLILGEAAGAVLGGARVIPKRTIESGYVYKNTDLDFALKKIFK
jgi:uncharacterized protein